MLTEGAAEHSCTQEADKENQNTAGLTSTQNPPLISLVSGCDVKLSHFAPPGGYTKWWIVGRDPYGVGIVKIIRFIGRSLFRDKNFQLPEPFLWSV